MRSRTAKEQVRRDLEAELKARAGRPRPAGAGRARAAQTAAEGSRKQGAGQGQGKGVARGSRGKARVASGKFESPRPAREPGEAKPLSTKKKKAPSRASGKRDEARSARGRARVVREESRGEHKKPRPRPKAEGDAPEAPKRVPLSAPRGGIQPSDWLFTTREGSEQDLIDELVLANVVQPPPHVLYPSLVVSPRWPKREHQLIPVTFARQALPVHVSTNHPDPEVRFEKLVRVLSEKLAKAKQFALHVWVPDSTSGNPLASIADGLDEKLGAALAKLHPEAHRIDDSGLRRLASVPFVQVCVATPEHWIGGVHYSNQALSLAKGGRTRVRVTGDLPSRAARKIEEALAWLGVAPGPGEVCVDLGAAPGGWTYVLSERKAKVIAVDPAKLRPEIEARKNVIHLPQNAFKYEPDERIDWLFCDMAYRPLEVAAMLARWGRRGWARMLVANIKLPMTKKAEILARVRDILEREGEWKHLKARQLYHDRDEITLTALRA